MLRTENASPRIYGMFYKATVQAILLFGSETWNITTPMKNRLEGFHIRAAYRMVSTNKPHRMPGGEWRYPALTDVLKEAGLFTITYYVEIRRQTITSTLSIGQFLIFAWRGRDDVGPAPASIGGSKRWILMWQGLRVQLQAL